MYDECEDEMMMMGWMGGYQDDRSFLQGLRSGFAEKSGAASRREEAVKKLFSDCKDEVETEVAKKALEATQNVAKKEKKVETRHYLTESGVPHLTSACWKTFSSFVRSHDGWVPKRELLTESEKNKLGRSEKRNGKMYKISVIYSMNVPTADLGGFHWEKAAPAAEAAADAQTDSAKKRKMEPDVENEPSHEASSSSSSLPAPKKKVAKKSR